MAVSVATALVLFCSILLSWPTLLAGTDTQLSWSYPVKSVHLFPTNIRIQSFLRTPMPAGLVGRQFLNIHMLELSDGSLVVGGTACENRTAPTHAFALRLNASGGTMHWHWGWDGTRVDTVVGAVGAVAQLPGLAGDILVAGWREIAGVGRRCVTKLMLNSGAEVWSSTSFGDGPASHGAYESIHTLHRHSCCWLGPTRLVCAPHASDVRRPRPAARPGPPHAACGAEVSRGSRGSRGARPRPRCAPRCAGAAPTRRSARRGAGRTTAPLWRGPPDQSTRYTLARATRTSFSRPRLRSTLRSPLPLAPTYQPTTRVRIRTRGREGGGRGAPAVVAVAAHQCRRGISPGRICQIVLTETQRTARSGGQPTAAHAFLCCSLI